MARLCCRSVHPKDGIGNTYQAGKMGGLQRTNMISKWSHRPRESAAMGMLLVPVLSCRSELYSIRTYALLRIYNISQLSHWLRSSKTIINQSISLKLSWYHSKLVFRCPTVQSWRQTSPLVVPTLNHPNNRATDAIDKFFSSLFSCQARQEIVGWLLRKEGKFIRCPTG